MVQQQRRREHSRSYLIQFIVKVEDKGLQLVERGLPGHPLPVSRVQNLIRQQVQIRIFFNDQIGKKCLSGTLGFVSHDNK